MHVYRCIDHGAMLLWMARAECRQCRLRALAHSHSQGWRAAIKHACWEHVALSLWLDGRLAGLRAHGLS